MTVAVAPVLPPPALSADYLLDTPLPQLLEHLGVKLVESSITDRTFFGALLERRDGTRVLSMPVGRSGYERDTAARMLLAEGLGL
ncbi:hypothetical protein [Streptomyces sp. NPDC091299]|uniref:hypothetical protein n=1 Tax=Streptomyces sp. NPDC091299 TaxID=3155302 RepID=UPI00341C7EAD